jgi:uncharacterized Fe-S center protein
LTSPVYFWNLRAGRKTTHARQLARLLRAAGADQSVDTDDFAALKLHFGEAGVTGQIAPLLVRPIVEFYKKAGARPFLTDTNTLYAGERGEAVSHALLAAAHGYDPNVLGAPVIIADGLRSTNEIAVECQGRHFTEAYLAGDILAADHLVSLAHFKGHGLAGMGGALKNVAMGCATRRGKMQQHNMVGPMLKPENCVGCGSCLAVCAPGALTLDENRQVRLDPEACVGCGSCFHECSDGAIHVDWRTDYAVFAQRMLEYAAAVLQSFVKPSFFVNFVTSVTPECDCIGFSDAPLVADQGVLASFDPVALDQACLDLVNAAPPLPGTKLAADVLPGQDKFRLLYKDVPEDYGLGYAEELGLGSRSYELVGI